MGLAQAQSLYNSSEFIITAHAQGQHMYLRAAPAGAGWRVSESVLNDLKVIKLNLWQGIKAKKISK